MLYVGVNKIILSFEKLNDYFYQILFYLKDFDLTLGLRIKLKILVLIKLIFFLNLILSKIKDNTKNIIEK